MDEMTLNLLSRCLRYLLYSYPCMIFALYLLYKACGMKQSMRKWWGWFIVLLQLRMLLNVLVLEVLAFFHGEEAWYPLLLDVNSLIHPLVAIVILLAYEGPLGKSIFALTWLEAIATGCQMMAWNLAYWGTGDVYVMSGQPLRLRDLWMAILYVPLCALCNAALSSVLKFYRNYRFRHPRLLLGLGLLTVFRRAYINFFTATFHSAYHMTVDLLFCEVIIVLLLVVFMKKARLRKEIYAEQQRSVEVHLRLLREQTAWIADSRAQMEEQIGIIESLSGEKQGELAETYLTELKEQYRTFLAGIRCKDQMVDALLCYKEILCSQQGISTEFSLQQYDRGILEEQEVAALLLMLFDGAIQNCQKDGASGHISLYMALVRGQLLVEMGYSGKRKLAKEGFRPILVRHDGTLLQERTAAGRKVKILLRAGQATE